MEPFDRWFLLVTLALAGGVEELAEPLLVPLVHHFYAWSEASRQTVAGWSVATQVIVFLFVTDFLGYWAHRLMHSATFWRVHALHHSPRSLNWFSGMRGSPLHMVLVLTPAVLTSALFLLTENRTAFYVLLLIEMASQHFTHSNIHVPFARQLEYVLVTPRMHFVHHHREAAYGNSNYGFYFSIWDHIFGTYIEADSVPRRADLGLMENYTLGSLFVGLQLREAPATPDSPVPALEPAARERT